MKTTISSKGRLLIPVEIRRQDHIEHGQEFIIERLQSGRYMLECKPKHPNEGLFEILLSCPVKDWFQPLVREETTDDIAL